MRAILSDIHGNLEALQAVLEDIAASGATETICLGDIVGYGPNPIECITLSMSWPVVLQGMRDFAAVSDDDLSGFPLPSATSLFWVRTLLADSPQGARCRVFLTERPRTYKEGGVLFVHGSPRNPLSEYLFPEDIGNQKKMARIAECFSGYCFNGHTHVPGVFVEDRPGTWRYLSPTECGSGYRLDDRKTICNVGSVGQPRDGDWRACYALFDGEVVRFRRVEYDVEATFSKIYANSELAYFFGERLREGR